MIEDFIKQLDIPTPVSQVEVTEIIRLEYATADSLAQVLGQVWQDPQSDEDEFGFRRFFSSRFDDEEPTDINSLFGKVTVYSDPDTNSLIVTTRRRYLDQVRALIKRLDFVRGQVRIDIKILEVTLDETTKLGIEVAANEKKLAGIELSPSNPLVGDTNAELGLAQEISGFNYSLVTNEYMALLHTLIRENKVKTLSTPTITTRDSRPATWSSGRRIPYLQSVDTNSILGDTATQPLFNYDFIDPPVGINISLTPYIARSQAGEDGKRTIGLDITNISASNFIEFTDFNAPITDDNSLSVYIDVEDGQKLIVGGIIRKKQKQVENKVPILGDIPLLGRLFKSTETEVQDTEIVFIITPHIIDIKNPDDIKKLKKTDDNWLKNGKSDLEESIK
jgi:general secretion pathway protein D